MCIFTVAMYANSTADVVLVVRGTYKEFFTNTTNDGLTFTWTLEDREMWDQALPKVLNVSLPVSARGIPAATDQRSILVHSG